MLDTCIAVSGSLCLKFNSTKSYCILLGNCQRNSIDPVRLESNIITWVNSIKFYEYVWLVTGGY